MNQNFWDWIQNFCDLFLTFRFNLEGIKGHVLDLL